VNAFQRDALYSVKTLDPRMGIRSAETLHTISEGTQKPIITGFQRPITFGTRRDRARVYANVRRSMMRLSVSFAEMAEYCKKAGIAAGKLYEALKHFDEMLVRVNMERYNKRLANRVPSRGKPKRINGRLRSKRERLSHRSRSTR
jgi:hypothetical protein